MERCASTIELPGLLALTFLMSKFERDAACCFALPNHLETPVNDAVFARTKANGPSAWPFWLRSLVARSIL
jgi:hypothetical protein